MKNPNRVIQTLPTVF